MCIFINRFYHYTDKVYYEAKRLKVPFRFTSLSGCPLDHPDIYFLFTRRFVKSTISASGASRITVAIPLSTPASFS